MSALVLLGLGGAAVVAPAASAAAPPDVPGVVEVHPASGGVTVTWQPAERATGSAVTSYVVEWVDTAGRRGEGVRLPRAARTARLTGLTNGQMYWACVYAVNPAGRSACSPSSGTVTAGAPAAPVMSWTRLPDGRFRGAWDAVDGNGSAVTSYQLFYDAQEPRIDVASWDAGHPQPSGPQRYWFDVDLAGSRIYGHASLTLAAVDQFGRTFGYSVVRAGPADRLKAPDRLFPGEQITSPNGRYSLRVQTDGNLVVYADGARPLWNSGSWGSDAGETLLLQDDGNLLFFALHHTGLSWSSATWGNRDTQLVMQDDGNLVLYAEDGRPLWSSGWDRGRQAPHDTLWATQELRLVEPLTSPDGQSTLVLTYDRDAVVYRSGRGVWATPTHYSDAIRLRMQSDGNLVLCSSTGRPLWSSGTYGHLGSRVVMQDDGNLVVYAADGRALWSSMFGRTY